MKQFLLLLIITSTVLVYSCSAEMSDSSSQQSIKTKTSDQQLSNNTKFKYLDYMYIPVYGENLNQQYLKGEIYERYPDEVKAIINLLLKFPIQTPLNSNPTNQQNLSMQNYIDKDWYNTLPQEILDYLKQQGIDIASEGLSKGLIMFIESEEGQAYMQTLMDDLEERCQNMAKYAIEEFAKEFEEEMNYFMVIGGIFALSETAMAGTAVYAAMAGNIMIQLNPVSSILTVASMLQSHFQHKQMMAQLQRIEQLLSEIQVTLDKIEKKIDLMLGYTIDINLQLKYEDAKKARQQLQIIERQLVYLHDLQDENNKDLIKDFISGANLTEDGFQVMMERAFQSATDTQQWLVNEGYTEKIETPKIEIYKLKIEEGWSVMNRSSLFDIELPSLKIPYIRTNILPTESIEIPTPVNFVISDSSDNIHIGYNDILMMIKLSKARLDLSELVYEGETLLNFREYFSRNDLNTYFIPINNAIDNSFNTLEKTFLELTNHTFPKNEKKTYHVFVLCYNGKALYLARQSGRLVFTYDMVNDVISNRLGIDVRSCPQGIGSDSINIMDFRLKNILEGEETINEAFQAYTTQVKAINTAWMMTLQAHIDAGSNN